MAQFIPFAPNVEALGASILAFQEALPTPDSRKRVIDFLEKNGIKKVDSEKYYPQKTFLKTLEMVSQLLGPSSTFLIGKLVPEKAIFPPQIDTLEKALNSIDVAYGMNHRYPKEQGDKDKNIGYYKLISFDSVKKNAVMECKNPYASEFDRGIISAMLRKFKPKDASMKYDVVLDTTKKPTRLSGGDSDFFNIYW